VVVDGANRNDMKLVEESLCSVPQSIEDRRLEHLEAAQEEQGLCMDKGYDCNQVREIVDEFGYTAHIRARGEEKKACEAGQMARRWVVERAHSWLNRFRRLLVRWEKKALNYLALLHFACAIITWNRCLFG